MERDYESESQDDSDKNSDDDYEYHYDQYDYDDEEEEDDEERTKRVEMVVKFMSKHAKRVVSFKVILISDINYSLVKITKIKRIV